MEDISHVPPVTKYTNLGALLNAVLGPHIRFLQCKEAEGFLNALVVIDYVHVADYVNSGKSISMEEIREFLEDRNVSRINPELIDIASGFIFATISNEPRRFWREKVYDFFSSVGSKNETCMKPEVNVKVASVWNTPAVSPVYPSEFEMSSDDAAHEKSLKKIDTLIRNRPMSKFVGLNYIPWRHEVIQFLECYRLMSWDAYYAILSFLDGPPLQTARSVTWTDIATDMPRFVMEALDSQYLTQAAVDQFELEYANLKQNPNEAISDFAMRFFRIVDTRQRLYNSAALSDSELRAKFNVGLSFALNQVKGLASVIAPDMKSYVQACINLEKTLKPTTPPVLRNNAGQLKSRKFNCYRCGKEGHSAEKCTASHVINLKDRCRRCGRKPDPSPCKCDSSKFSCRRCGQGGHVASICEKSLSEKSEDSDVLRMKVNVGTVDCSYVEIFGVEKSELYVSSSCFEKNLRIGGFVPGTPFTETNVLVDSGASSNFVSDSVYQCLLKNSLILEEKYLACNVTFGNSSKTPVSKAVRVECAIEEYEGCLWFIVVEKCNPHIIVGRPTIAKANMYSLFKCVSNTVEGISNATIPDPESTIAVFEESGCKDMNCTTSVVVNPSVVSAEPMTAAMIERVDGKWYCRCPLMENCHVLPFREKERRSSKDDARIMLARLRRMVQEEKAESISPSEATVILACVLVDKRPGTPRVYYDTDDKRHEELHSRYRITLDARPLNEMHLIRLNNETENPSYGFVPIPASDVVRTEGNQHQSSAMDVIRELSDHFIWFGRLDIKDAYSSLSLNPRLRRLFCAALRVNGATHYFRYTSLPQGWKHSSYLFHIAMEEICIILNPLLETFKAKVVHYQDDLPVAAQTEEDCNNAIRFAIKFLRDNNLIENLKILNI